MALTWPGQHARNDREQDSTVEALEVETMYHLCVWTLMHAVHPHIAARRKAAMPDLQHLWWTDSNANMCARVCMQSSHTLQQKDRLMPDLHAMTESKFGST